MGKMNVDETVAKIPKAKTTHHKLEASNERHAASFYDKKSSHYQGGAHNVLLNLAKERMAGVKPVARNTGNHGHNAILDIAKAGMSGVKTSSSTKNSGNHGHNAILDIAKAGMNGKVSTIPSQKSLGGSHNVAMAVLAESSRQFKKTQQQKKVQSSGMPSMSSMTSFFSNFGTKQVSEK